MSFDNDFFDDYMYEDATGGFDEEDGLSGRNYDPELFFDDDGDCNYDDIADYGDCNYDDIAGYDDDDDDGSQGLSFVLTIGGRSNDNENLTPEQIEFRKKYYNSNNYPAIREFVRENYPEVKLTKSEEYELSDAFFSRCMKKQPDLAFTIWKDILEHFPQDMLLEDSRYFVDDFLKVACQLQDDLIIDELKNDEDFYDALLVNAHSSIGSGRIRLFGVAIDKKDYDFFWKLYDLTKKQFVDLKGIIDKYEEDFEEFIYRVLDNYSWRLQNNREIELLEKIRDDQTDEELINLIDQYIEEINDELEEERKEKEKEEKERREEERRVIEECEEDCDDELSYAYLYDENSKLRKENYKFNSILGLLMENQPVNTRISGIYYLEDKSVIDDAKINTPVTLVREKDNEYDSNAILVLLNDKKLGYVPRGINDYLAKIMDSGKALTGTIFSIYMTAQNTNIKIDITMAE